jgi:plasmid stabilization system protein ParE
VKQREIRFARGADDDLARLFQFLAEKDVATAQKALVTIRNAFRAAAAFPFSCRKADKSQPFRECVIPFGNAGYVAAFEIADDHILILVVRHQREDDYS